MNIEDTIKKLMAQVFKVDLILITDDVGPGAFPKWDSLNHINLIAAIEDEFDIEIDDDEYEEMVSFKIIVAIVNSYMEG